VRRRRRRHRLRQCVAGWIRTQLETNDTVWHIIADFVARGCSGPTSARARRLSALKAIRGQHGEAAVEMAAWDLFARLRGGFRPHVLGARAIASPPGCRSASADDESP
jgi:hypothetical protein